MSQLVCLDLANLDADHRNACEVLEMAQDQGHSPEYIEELENACFEAYLKLQEARGIPQSF